MDLEPIFLSLVTMIANKHKCKVVIDDDNKTVDFRGSRKNSIKCADELDRILGGVEDD